MVSAEENGLPSHIIDSMEYHFGQILAQLLWPEFVPSCRMRFRGMCCYSMPSFGTA